MNEFKIKKLNLQDLAFNALVCITPTSIASLVIFLLALHYYHLLTPILTLLAIPLFICGAVYVYSIGFLNGQKKFAEISISSFINGATRLIIVAMLFLIFKIKTPTAAILAITSSVIFTFIYTLPKVSHFLNTDFRTPNKALIGSLYSSSFFLSFADIARNMLYLIPIFILSSKNLVDVALFTMAITFFTSFDVIIMNLPQSMIPLVSEKFSQTGKITKMPLQEFTLLSTFFLILVGVVFYLNLDFMVVTVIFSEKYMRSLPLLRVLMVSMPFYAYTRFADGVLIGIGKTKERLKIELFTLLLAIILFLIAAGLGVMTIVIVVDSLIIFEAINFHLLIRKISQSSEILPA